MDNLDPRVSRYLPALMSQQADQPYTAPTSPPGIHPSSEYRIIIGTVMMLLGLVGLGFEVYMVFWTILYEIALHPGPVADVSSVRFLAVILGLFVQASLPLVGVFTTPSWIQLWKRLLYLFSSKAPLVEVEMDPLQVIALIYMVIAIATSVFLATLFVVARTTEPMIISIAVFFCMVAAVLFLPLGWHIFKQARQEILEAHTQDTYLSGGEVIVTQDGSEILVMDLPPGTPWPLGELLSPEAGNTNEPPQEKVVESDNLPFTPIDE